MTQKKGNEMKRINDMKRINHMNRMKNGLVLAALSLGLLGAAGCAGLQQPAPAAPAPAEQVNTAVTFGGAIISVYRPDTRTMYLWSGDPRTGAKRPMSCSKVQLNENPTVAPKLSVCN
jgi:hypothetical protein